MANHASAILHLLPWLNGTCADGIAVPALLHIQHILHPSLLGPSIHILHVQVVLC